MRSEAKQRESSEVGASGEDGRAGDARQESGGGNGRPNQAQILVELAQDAEFFHDADGAVYATLRVDGHKENYPLKSASFREWLCRQFWDDEHKAPSSQAMQNAMGVLAGKGRFEGAVHEVWVRMAEHGGAFYLDLCDERWRAVEVTAAGWRVVADPPVKFVRKKGMQALAVPTLGGAVDELRAFVNVTAEDTWVLVKAFMLGAMHRRNKYPILGVNGEHGSAKMTLCRMIRATIDPNHADLRSALPRTSGT